ncbi:hypothetical protein SAMN05421644_16510 [Allochromatium warmingii]|uniref:Uncharacterized protein n=1 Tax=Allochromatium warmingii TaxID=61595 RepID=A0A1H3JUM8_ALLWA|nr:hypothetical protein [Allochromatium warmingii]SDY43048.1 hypothetical protein SAMN05421644_16510 [Allochromatium warmingii]
MKTRPNADFALEAIRACLSAADDLLCFGASDAETDKGIWLVTAAAILTDLAIEQRQAKSQAKQGGAE